MPTEQSQLMVSPETSLRCLGRLLSYSSERREAAHSGSLIYYEEPTMCQTLKARTLQFRTYL